MKTDAHGWTRSRWAAAIGAGVGVHLAAALILARPGFRPALESVGRPPSSGWVAGRPDPLAGFLVTPTRFALPSGSSFSAAAARGLPRVEYEVSTPAEGATFLGAGPDGSRLGTVPRGPSPRPNPPSVLPPPGDALPVTRLAAVVGTAELRAPAHLGLPIRPVEVPAWTGAGSPQPTRVEFAVNVAGSVVATRTILSSGSREADAAALGAVRNLRFPSRAPRPGFAWLDPSTLSWGVATLHPVAGAAPAPPTAGPASR